MKDPYEVLGIDRSADDDEVKAAYRRLARKYHPDNYTDDNPLKELAEDKMQEINAAYDAIQNERAGKSSYNYGNNANNNSQNGANNLYAEVRQFIQGNRIVDAEKLLMTVDEYDRVAEWHYLMSICLMQRGRANDAMRELEIACNMDPSNAEYQQAKQMLNNRAGGYGSTYYDDGRGYRRSDTDRACDCCTNLICLDCLCECMGGDLIRCI